MSIDEAITQLLGGTLPRDQFLSELQDTPLAVSLIANPDDSKSLTTFQSDEWTCAAAFTSPVHAGKSNITGVLATLTGRQLALQWPPELVLYLNPGSADDARLMIPGTEVQRMGRDDLNLVEQEGTAIRVGAPPNDPPAELSSAATRLVNSFPEIEVAYLFQMSSRNRQAGLVLGVVVGPNHDADDVMPRAAKWIAEQLPPRAGIELLSLSDSLRTAVSEYVPEIHG